MLTGAQGTGGACLALCRLLVASVSVVNALRHGRGPHRSSRDVVWMTITEAHVASAVRHRIAAELCTAMTPLPVCRKRVFLKTMVSVWCTMVPDKRSATR